MRRISIAAAAFAAVLMLAGIAAAQDVTWEEPGPLGAGQPAALSLVFTDTEPLGRVTPPSIDGLTVLGAPSQQSSVSIVNGARSDSLMLTFPVRAQREGSFTIPSFTVETAAGRLAVPALTLRVGAAMLPSQRRGSAAAPLDEVVEARLTPKRMTPYAGEVFDVDATIGLAPGRRGQVIGTPAWNDSDLVTEPWSEGRQVSVGEGAGVHFRTRAVAPEAGRHELSPIQQDVEIEVGRSRGGDPFAAFGDAFGSMRKFGGADLLDSFFSRPQTSAATVQSNSVQLDVQPLPQPAPPEFSGAVGQFTLESTLAPAQPKTGDPLTWTLTLAGTGNWTSVALPARAVPNEFRTLQPKQNKQFAAGQLFDGSLSEDLVLVPNQPGDYQLAAVRFVYFDPALGQYQTIEAQPPLLHISGAPIAPKAQLQPQGAAAAPAPAAHTAAAPSAAAPAGVVPSSLRLPHDPLPGSATSFTPLSLTHLAQIAALPLLLFIAYWIALALRHARLTDPRRPQRLAFKALLPAVERIRAAATADQRLAALLAWQRTAATALGIDLAAPTAAQLPDQRWADVWSGSERALYAREHALPGGWCDRARGVATRSRAPRFNPLRALSARHLIPKTATAALLLLCAVAPVRAAEPLEAYGSGDFAAARAQWLERAQQEPSDWIARYNLGLSAAQLGDAPRAVADTLAAFVRAPRDAAVRWNASALAAAVPGLDGRIAALLADDSLASLASPAAWQALCFAGGLLACAGAAAMVRRRYGATPRLARLGPVALLGGLALAGTATFSLHAYGPLADPRAALVAGQPLLRSVPTDAEAAQQQKPLPAGTLVLAEREFLGWMKVTLRGGETGWLRHGDLVPLYAAPSA